MTESRRGDCPLEVYLHIPFCVRKCNYCDFLSMPVSDAVKERYMDALLSEVRLRRGECAGYRVKTVFFGGGTPSLVDQKWILRIMDALRENYDLDPGAEVTLELNPGTAEEEKLRAYRRAGINRLSIGLQSALDGELEILGRVYTSDRFFKVYREARDAGFSNINVDIMRALPGQTPESCRKTLEAVMSLVPQPEHISSYSLMIEEGTPFYRLREAGKLALPGEDDEKRMDDLTKEILEEYGFLRYEISNYAKKGYECRHNCGYWRRTPYLGFGVGAASLMNGCRFKNGEDMAGYMASPLAFREEPVKLSREEEMEEFMFLGLRMTEGVSAHRFREQFGIGMEEVYGQVLLKNMRDGLMETRKQVRDGEPDRAYYLTDRGMDVSNYVMAQFIAT